MISGFLVKYKYNFRTFSHYFWHQISKPGPHRSFCKGMEVFWMIYWFLLTIELILTGRGKRLSARRRGFLSQVQLSRRAKVSACKWRFLWFDLVTLKNREWLGKPSQTFFALPQIWKGITILSLTSVVHFGCCNNVTVSVWIIFVMLIQINSMKR